VREEREREEREREEGKCVSEKDTVCMCVFEKVRKREERECVCL